MLAKFDGFKVRFRQCFGLHAVLYFILLSVPILYFKYLSTPFVRSFSPFVKFRQYFCYFVTYYRLFPVFFFGVRAERRPGARLSSLFRPCRRIESVETVHRSFLAPILLVIFGQMNFKDFKPNLKTATTRPPLYPPIQ